MQIEIHSRRNARVSSWSGGETTELWLFPSDGDYASRNFRVRISSATVRLPESDFTPLDGVVRYITPLVGSFTLSHPDGQTITMQPLSEPYRFDGGTPTHCSGTATDFNLMLKGADGTMSILRGKQSICGLCCVYPVGGASLTVNGKPLAMDQGDLAVISTDPTEHATISTEHAILCTIKSPV